MKPLLRKEILRLVVWMLLGSLLGYLVDRPILGAAAALLIVLGQHLWQLQRLVSWLQQPNKVPPEAARLWGEVFDGIYHYQRRQKADQQHLAGLLSRIQDSSQALRDGVVMIDHKGDLEWWNHAAERLLGLSSSTDRGQPLTYLLRHPQFVDYYDRQDYLEPLVLPSPVEEEHLLEYQITLFGKNERLLLVRDCTKMQHLERMRQDFIANVSHELRTPLTVLSGYLETFSDHAEQLPAQWQRGLVLMTQQSARMEHLVADLLTLSRLEANDFKVETTPINVAELLAAIRLDALALSGQQYQLLIDADPQLYLRGSANELRSAFSNLVFNAVKYTPQGSTIELRWYQDENGAYLEVDDNGQGIDGKHLAHLTQRFYRVDNSRSSQTGGTGLGLAIVKHILRHHQGRLEISSVVGQGSRFTCCFPLSQTLLDSAA
ncbi:MAG: phosphate regulon sensor histidine kinase PhoR [Pseudomonas sp.]|jgi:two-component system phosphate regulon sensor histidine kinase PhoR|nr:phosphate regulon sensor histidine kinase PhoR [Pseudomonas sp.]MDY0415936.1 phosphate regulon sensor histidine kinase PhoR [Pseudomonas sp.]NLO53410.1 phosphate regulon sensor histidine kinase PhoR [Gammaproteobacteria bacterium]